MTYAVLVFILGSIVGSFLNVVILRTIREESIIYPGSHCVQCNHDLCFTEMIPILSYIAQGGRCKHCREKINLQYPIVESLTGIVFLIIFWRFPIAPELFYMLIVACMLIVLSVIDILTFDVYDKHLVLLIIIQLIYYFHHQSLFSNINSLIIMAAFSLIMRIAARNAIGTGDLKLWCILAMNFTMSFILKFLFISIWMGGAYALYLLIKGKAKNTKIPMVPFISGAFIFCSLF